MRAGLMGKGMRGGGDGCTSLIYSIYFILLESSFLTEIN